MIYFLIGLCVVILLVMLLKRILHLRVDDFDYSSENDYLERRVKKDDEENK